MRLTRELAAKVGVKTACLAMGVARATFYRRLRPPVRGPKRTRHSHRALSRQERQRVLDLLLCDSYVDESAAQVYYDLLSRGIYLASIRTMYRILAQHGLTTDRRHQRKHPHHVRPVLSASTPNRVWTWDITMMAGVRRRESYQLAVVIDLYSRYVVGWMLDAEATADSCQLLVATAMLRQGLSDSNLILHSDRGPQMKAASWADLEAGLGLQRSFSRPRVSNDNPFVEAHFKTLKYRPVYPGRFESLQDARGFCQDFFRWYNHVHFHSGIGWMTPHDVHYGLANDVYNTRQLTLEKAFQLHPERFNSKPAAANVPSIVGINLVLEVTFEPAHIN